MDKFYFDLLISSFAVAILLLMKFIWGRILLKKTLEKPFGKFFKYYIIQSVIRMLVLLTITLILILGDYVPEVVFLIMFLSGFFFVQLFEIRYLLSINNIP
ncbi:MAG: hypothetical protein Kapaf2KO_13850 [Candidatus Kapaibacteriales bacterium]